MRNGVFPAELDGKVFQYYSFYFNLELYNYNYNYDYRKKNVQLQHHGWPPETKETGMQKKYNYNYNNYNFEKATEESSSTT